MATKVAVAIDNVHTSNCFFFLHCLLGSSAPVLWPTCAKGLEPPAVGFVD